MRYLFLTSLLTLALSIGSAMGQTATDYYKMGVSKGKSGDLNGAIADFDQALLMNPRLVPALNNRAYAKLLKKDLDGALTDCGLALEIDPKSVVAHEYLAKINTIKGDFKAAISEYMTTISINPNIPLPYNNLGWIYATASDPSIRNGAKAIEYSTQACNLTQWKYPADLDTFAAACAEVGDFDQAVKWESEYLKVDPTSKTALARLALYQAHQPYHQDPAQENPSGSPTPAPKP